MKKNAKVDRLDDLLAIHTDNTDEERKDGSRFVEVMSDESVYGDTGRGSLPKESWIKSIFSNPDKAFDAYVNYDETETQQLRTVNPNSNKTNVVAEKHGILTADSAPLIAIGIFAGLILTMLVFRLLHFGYAQDSNGFTPSIINHANAATSDVYYTRTLPAPPASTVVEREHLVTRTTVTKTVQANSSASAVPTTQATQAPVANSTSATATIIPKTTELTTVPTTTEATTSPVTQQPIISPSSQNVVAPQTYVPTTTATTVPETSLEPQQTANLIPSASSTTAP